MIAVLDGNLKLKMEPSSTCIPYCGEIDVFVTLQAKDICKLLKFILASCYVCNFSCVQW